jgi:hypothetical protein
MVIMSIAIDIISTDEIHLREGTEGRGRTRRRNLITSEAQRAQRLKYSSPRWSTSTTMAGMEVMFVTFSPK